MSALKRLICLIICLLTSHNLFSQGLAFSSTSHSFGTIAEDGGVVKHTFSFKNSGSSPLVIISASSSCGCTTSNYSRQPIAAGAESTIDVTFDPMNAPGHFSKTVDIITAPDNARIRLTVTGDVSPRKRSTEELYPFDMGGGFRMSANYYPLSHIEQGRRTETQVAYANTSKKSVEVSLHPVTSSGVLKVEKNFTVAAGATGFFSVAYDLSDIDSHYGLLSDRYSIKVNGKEAKYPLIVNGHAVDRFTADERSAPPICNIDLRFMRLGEIRKGHDSSKKSFIIENTGINDLIVRDVNLGEGLKSSLSTGAVIEAGKSIKAHVWVTTKELDYGNFSKFITLTVNDPDQPIQRIRVTGIVAD